MVGLTPNRTWERHRHPHPEKVPRKLLLYRYGEQADCPTTRDKREFLVTQQSAGFNRRRFLKRSGLAGLAAGAVAAGGSPVRDAVRSLFKRPRYAADDLDVALLTPVEGETVAIAAPAGSVSLIVDDVTEEEPILSDDGKQVGATFRVLMSGSAKEAFAQGTYDVDSERVGSFPLFVVPNETSSGNVQLYEAVFSRLA